MMRENIWESIVIDRHTDVPLHAQLEEWIKHHIETGTWQPGSRLPSEREWMQRTGISRETVRHTLTSLLHQGIIEKRHGRGTYVRHPRYESPIHILYSFSEQLRTAGITLEDEVLERQLVPANEELAYALETGIGEPLISIQRLRRVQGTPMMYSLSYFVQRIFPQLLDEPLTTSLYRILRDKYHISIASATDKLEAISADADMARLLDVPRRTPLMYVERVARTSEDMALHVGYTYIRGDMFRFRSDMHMQPAALELKPPR